jgi:Protein of unknown function (DUF4235)
MSKLLFLPFRLATGLLAGLIGKQVIGKIWARVDEHGLPKPENRQVSLGRLALALALEGAMLRVIRGLLDHESRHGFAVLTGTWPGVDAPDAPTD